MALTESEQAQYAAMQDALIRFESALIESKIQRDWLQDKLSRIQDILEEEMETE